MCFEDLYNSPQTRLLLYLISSPSFTFPFIFYSIFLYIPCWLLVSPFSIICLRPGPRLTPSPPLKTKHSQTIFSSGWWKDGRTRGTLRVLGSPGSTLVPRHRTQSPQFLSCLFSFSPNVAPYI